MTTEPQPWIKVVCVLTGEPSEDPAKGSRAIKE